MDINAFMSNPIVLYFMIASILGVGFFYYYTTKDKGKQTVWILERPKVGLMILHTKVKMLRKKKSEGGEMFLTFPNGDEYVLPEEMRSTYEDLTDKDGKHHKLWGLENGQIVKWGADLAQAASPLLDHKTASAAMTRGSAKRLSAPKLPKTDLYLYLIMGCVVGVALGWILYPSFNHPQPIIEYMRVLPNGTVVPFGVLP